MRGELRCLDATWVGMLTQVGRIWHHAGGSATRYAFALVVAHDKTARQAAAFLEEVVHRPLGEARRMP